MKTIARHISSLLYDHECVIVPRLGAFLTNEVGASIDVNRGLLLPPRKEIVFNAQLSHNDGVLINAVAQSEGITFSEASKNIEAFEFLYRIFIIYINKLFFYQLFFHILNI